MDKETTALMEQIIAFTLPRIIRPNRRHVRAWAKGLVNEIMMDINNSNTRHR